MNPQITVSDLIAVLQTMPPDAEMPVDMDSGYYLVAMEVIEGQEVRETDD